jgi:glycosyltransferase involved in cell wall biosynthesis
MISVIIPCHATPENSLIVGQQLWYTVASAISSLEVCGEPYEILVILNGEHPQQASLMHQADSIKAIYCGKEIDSPQAARHLGFQKAKGDVLFSLDAHIIVPTNFFRQILDDMKDTGADFMGAAHRFLLPNSYGNRVDWGAYLWGGESIFVPPRGDKPFKTALHPHGAFAITREAYFDVGGYWLGLHGFGGEESQLCFKLWLMGRTCWATPRTHHWHWLSPMDRRNRGVFEDENFVRNFLIVAAAYSDEKQVRDSYDGMLNFHWGNLSKFPMAVQDALCDPEVKKEREFIAENGKYKNLMELREMFNVSGVLN